MTKNMWFKTISTVVIVLFLFFICFYEDRLVSSSLKIVENYCLEIEKAAKEDGTIVSGRVASLVDNLEDSWEKNESKLCFLVNHKSIENLGVEIVRLKTYIDEDEPIEFFVSLEIIKHYTEVFQHFMGASFHNVL